MGLLGSYPDNSSLTTDDKFATYDSTGALVLTTGTQVNQFLGDGWTIANDSWSFSSYANGVGVINTNSGATTRYTKGMWFRFTQATLGTKYAKVTAVATSSVTLLFTSGTQLDNEAISNPYYSTAYTPVGAAHGDAIRSFTNGGSAGGTFYYFNEGGIKRVWGRTAAISITGTGFQSTTRTLTLPSSFLTTIQTIQLTIGTPTNTQYLWAGLSSFTTSSVDVNLNQANGSNGSADVHIYILGT